jgi:hypothetical protein
VLCRKFGDAVAIEKQAAVVRAKLVRMPPRGRDLRWHTHLEYRESKSGAGFIMTRLFRRSEFEIDRCAYQKLHSRRFGLAVGPLECAC